MQDTGSWLEIGQSITFFCIASLLLLWSAAVSAAGEEGRSIDGETMIVEDAGCSGEEAELGSCRRTLSRVVLEDSCSDSLSMPKL